MKLSKKRKLKELEESRKRVESMKPIKGAKIIFLVFFIAGIILYLPGIQFFRNTFISPLLLLTAVLLVGLFGYALTNKFVLMLYKKSYSLLNTYLLSITFFGGLFYYILLSINFHLSNERSNYKKIAKVESVGRLGGKNRNPYVVITHKAEEKWLIFNSKTYIENPKSVKLEIEKGFFGFEVIKGERLSKD